MVVQRAQTKLVDFEIATNRDYEPNWHHEIIARELEYIESFGDKDFKILILSVPPRHGKSQQVSIDFPAWYLGRNPQKEIIVASYSADLAQDFGGKTREKVASNEFSAIFPHVRLKEDEKAKGQWKTQLGGSYVAVGVGGPITGRGANILLIDDPIKNREEAESEVYRQKIWDWFTSTAFTRLSPNGVVCLIMTRWNLDDLAGRIINHPTLSKRTRVICFQAIAEVDYPPHQKSDSALWPERYPISALTEIKDAIGPYDWSALYQGNPVPTQDQEFKREWLKPIHEDVVSLMNCRRYLTIDTAMSKKTQADFTAFCDNSVNKENFWHLRAWRAKIGPEDLVNNIFSLYNSNRYEKIGIEKTAYLEGLKPYLEGEQRKRGIFLPIIELEHKQTAKETRIRGLIPLYASKSIFHINGRCDDLENEMFTFPIGIHDDVLDATAYQLQIMEDNSHNKQDDIFTRNKYRQELNSAR